MMEYEIMLAIMQALVDAIEASEFRLVSSNIIDKNDYCVDESTAMVVVRGEHRKRIWITIDAKGMVELEIQNPRRVFYGYLTPCSAKRRVVDPTRTTITGCREVS